jgi:hypothetical protein
MPILNYIHIAALRETPQMLHSSTPLTAFIAFVVMGLMQVIPQTPEVVKLENGAGVYALLFIIFKEIIGLIKWFRKDPVEAKITSIQQTLLNSQQAMETKIIANGTALATLAATLSKFIGTMEEIEKKRDERMSQMRPCINEIQ